MGIPALLVPFFVSLLAAVPAMAADKARVAASERYEAGRVHRFVLGSVKHVPSRLRVAVRETGANEATVNTLATYASPKEAREAAEYWKKVATFYSKQLVLSLAGFGKTLRRMELEPDGKADQAVELSQEVRALEDLLEEAGSDLASKDDEIRELERNLKKASKGGSGGRPRGSEQMGRRLRTLYKSLQIDDRAVDDMVALRDETMRLKAEEKLKRLEEEADNVSVRRKVGGLPDQLSIDPTGNHTSKHEQCPNRRGEYRRLNQ